MDKKKAYVIDVDGKITEIAPQNGSDFQLEELYSIIECNLIETVYLGHSHVMIVDEEGKINDKPFNAKASILYSNPHDAIVGKAVVCPKKMFK